MLDRTRMLLDRLEGVKEMDGYWTALCPSHDDSNNSLVIKDGDKGGAIVKCHANKGCTVATICHGAGLTVSQIMPESQGFKPSRNSKLGSLVATYKYEDADGALLYEACRYEKEVDSGTQKTFTQRRPNNKGGWIYNMKGVTRVPYNLPEIVHGDSTEPILIVEGEKHCEKLRELGFIASCNVGGAGKWLKSYNSYFKGRDVAILPDNDDPGRKHALKVEKSLKGHARSINILVLPDLPEKGDVLDWFDQGNTGEELRAMVEDAVEHGTDGIQEKDQEVDHNSIEVDREIIKKLEIDVLGITEKGTIKIFSVYHKRIDEVKDVDRLTVTKLLAICGPAVRHRVFDGTGDPPAGTFTLRHVKQAISVLAGFRVLDEDMELGIGVWRKKGDDREDPSWVLVGASESAVLNGKLRRHAIPRFGDNILALSNNEPWYSFDQLNAAIEMYSPDYAKQICSQLEDWFSCWKFAHQDESPALLTGLAMATWIQTAWPWRPQVALSGQSASGKSSMFNFLDAIYGRLSIKSSGPTAAGLRQAVGNTACIVFADEMEDSRDRPRFFEMLRSSGSGDQIIRGSASHKVQSFGLQHIVWIGSTETGLQKEADLNRFIKISLLKPSRDESGSLPELAPDVLRAFGVKLLVVAMKCYERASQLLRMLIESKPTTHDIRIVQSFGVAASMYAAAMGMDDEETIETFRSMVSITETEDDLVSLQDELVDTILGSVIKVEKEDQMVSTVILRRHSVMDADACLANVGLRVFDDREANPHDYDILFVAHSQVKRTILRDTPFKNQNVGELLRRSPDAFKSKQRINGTSVNGTMIRLPNLGYDNSEKKQQGLKSGGFDL